jgi:hypothetical protein
MEEAKSTGFFNIPIQTISYKDKIAKNDQWGKNCIKAFINLASFSNSSYKVYLKKLYDYYNGVIDSKDYTSFLSPYGTQRTGIPNLIKNYPIIKPKIDLLRGEFAKRTDNFSVVVSNPDVINKKTEEKNKLIQQTIEQMFVNELNAQGVPTGQPTEETQTPEYVAAEFESTYRDKRAILGQHSLDFLKKYCKIEEKFDLQFLDFLTAGETYSFRDVISNEVVYECVNPLDIDYDKDPDIQFVEDADWICRRKYMTVSGIVDYFQGDDPLSGDEIADLEQSAPVNAEWFIPFAQIQDRQQPFKSYGRLLEVIHLCWKSRKKVGIVTFMDEYGQEQLLDVTEDYKAGPDEKIEWHWENEFWEGYRINNKYFKKIRAIPVQRGSLDNGSKCKAPYNGRVMSNRNSKNVSLVSLGVPFQVLYNGIHYRMELAIAKMKDQMSLLDVNIIPKGWDTDKFLDYLDLTGIGFVDYNKEGVRFNAQHQTSIKLASDTIQAYMGLLTHIKSEWDDVCGISRQREGQVSSSETVGGVERAVVQSSLITEMYFRMFDQFKEREYQALLDYSRLAWINGKKTSFVHPEYGNTVYMDLDPEYSEAELGIFMSNSTKDMQKMQKLEQLTQAMAQNGTPGSTIAEIIEQESFVEIKNALRKAEAKAQEFQQHMEEVKGQQQEQAMQAAAEAQDKKHQYDLELIDRQGYWDLQKTQLTALGIDEGENSKDILAQAKLGFEQSKFEVESQMKDKEISANQYNDDKRMAHENLMKDKEVAIKEKEIAAKKDIASRKPKS